MCRHEVDWLYGINLSRALTQSALKASKRYSTLSTGRVQGPTLRFVVEREREIETFVPAPYWVLRAIVNVDGELIEAECEVERFNVKAEAEQTIGDCAGKMGVVEQLESQIYLCFLRLHSTSQHCRPRPTEILVLHLALRSASLNDSTWIS